MLEHYGDRQRNSLSVCQLQVIHFCIFNVHHFCLKTVFRWVEHLNFPLKESYNLRLLQIWLKVRASLTHPHDCHIHGVNITHIRRQQTVKKIALEISSALIDMSVYIRHGRLEVYKLIEALSESTAHERHRRI
ncbi:hypothetical protein HZS_2020 [Henneguya salminicola]|nr:hypothetical protein HZS_2020 [Henneguya salminicola]